MLVDLLPLMAQVVFTCASWPRVKTLLDKKHSDQHSILYHLGIAAGHCMMLTWVSLTQPTWAAITAYLIALSIATYSMGLVMWYRKYPGGKPRTRRASHVHMPHEGKR